MSLDIIFITLAGIAGVFTAHLIIKLAWKSIAEIYKKIYVFIKRKLNSPF
jgi:hypothetical protein